MVAPASYEYSTDIIRRRLEGENIPLVEYELLRRDGTTFYGETLATILRSDDGAPSGYICVTRDITDRKRAEAEHRLLQAQLHQAQKMESIGRLAGGVAHDFNNLLGVILGETDLALDDLTPGDPRRPPLERIKQAAERSAALTRQLLAFARQQPVAPQVLDLNRTVETSLRMLGRLVGENIALSWQPGRELWSVKIDPSQIDQLLANLCVNARAAIAGVGKVTIETSNVTLDDVYCAEHGDCAPGTYVMLAVRDDGCGMTREVQERIFRAVLHDQGVGQGHGLGVSDGVRHHQTE